MINKGVIVSNVNRTVKKTVVVMGVARSGTSMTAQVLHDLGVEMGKKHNGIYIERKDVTDLLENGRLEDFESLVTYQNNHYPIWGWKRPKSIEYVELFENRIRNPHYIIPFRDYVSIAVRNKMAIDLDAQKNVIDTHINRYSKIVEFIKVNKKPILLFSYEKAVQYPYNFASQVAKFIGISDKERIKKAAKSINAKDNAYLKVGKYQGNLDRIKSGKVHGWAKRKNGSQPLRLRVLVNKKVVAKVIANKPRKDLTKIGDYAFVSNLNGYNLRVGQTYQIAVVDQHGIHIPNSPKRYLHEL